MVKGVNKNVIEISDTGNDIFERAILFVRPESHDGNSEHLKRRAYQFVAGLKLRPWLCQRGGLAVSAVKLIAAAAFGASVAVFFLR